MNKSIFIGRMATDPKVMSSAGKKTVAYFRIAVERNFKQEGAPNADYFSCVTFGERAEFVAKYFYKGKKIALEGEMHNDNYTGNSGEKVYGMRLLVNDIEFVDSKDESENVSQNGRTNRNSSMDDPARIQEIPIKIRHTTKTRTRGKQTVQEVNHKEPSLHARIHKTATT